MHPKLLVPLTLFLINLSFGQITPKQANDVDDLVSNFMLKRKVPGIAFAIVVKGQMVHTKGLGLADVENKVPTDENSIFRIASVSKPVTATAAMKLVEKGKLDLEAPVQKYCPAFPLKPWTITTKQLLTHQSGIRDYRNDEETLNTRHYKNIVEALHQFSDDPLDFEPGTKFNYTSYGYVVLGCVLEGAAGLPFEEFMRESVFEPAGMSSTQLDDVFAIIPHRVHGYQRLKDGSLKNAIFVDVSNKPPGSGINSSSSDMGKFIAALYAHRLVSQSSLDRIFTTAETRDGGKTIYGLGFFLGGPLKSHDGSHEAGHGGDQQGYSSVLYLLPEKQFGVVILSNLEGQNLSFDFITLARQIYETLYHHP